MRERIYTYYKGLEQRENLNVFEAAALRFFSALQGAIQSLRKHKATSKLYLKARSLARHSMGINYKFISMEDAMLWTQEWVKDFSSRDIDIIIGIPRSGLFVANIMAQKFAKPLSTPELFIKNQVWMSRRMPKKDKFVNVLLVDDYVSKRGQAMTEAVDILKQYPFPINLTKASLIVTPFSKHLVDSYKKEVPPYSWLEWAFLHIKQVNVVAYDMDGVLCEDIPPGVDADEGKYQQWICNAKSYMIPSYEIDFIISSRLEKYRPQTEAWLKQNGVKYKELILWDVPSKADRGNNFVQFKIDALAKTQPGVFFESNARIARGVWDEARVPTLCTDEMVMYS